MNWKSIEPERLYFKLKITGKKSPDQLIYRKQLISLNIIFQHIKKPINYLKGCLNTLVTFSDYWQKKQVKSVT